MRATFSDLLPEHLLSDDPADLLTYGQDYMKRLPAAASLVLFPEETSHVEAIIRRCNERRIALIPSGGRTGQTGATAACKGEVILSLQRMRRIFEVRETERSLHCQAGVTIQEIQEKARSNELYFPVDYASKGSAQIGGGIATNAGGIHVMKYGNIRNWVLGVDVVSGAGERLRLNRRLIKNNTGYDLRSLFIGSEGTLGVVTEATLLLTSPPGDIIRVFCALDTLTSVLPLLKAVRAFASELSVFELITGDVLQKVIPHQKLTPPFDCEYPYYALLEFEGMNPVRLEAYENALGRIFESGIVKDMIISQNSKQAETLLAYREKIPSTLAELHRQHKYDISVPVESVIDFISELNVLLERSFPQYRSVLFGHVADGNLHVNILKPSEQAVDEFYAFCPKIDDKVYGLIEKFEGSIAAEHGVGLLKKDALHFSRSGIEMDLMRQMKKVFDPNGILNPGKIFDLK